MERVFAENLQRIRKSRGFKTQEAVSAAAGIPFRTYQDWERGLHLPRGKALKQLAATLSVPEATLFASPDIMAPPKPDEALSLVKKALALLERFPPDVLDQLVEMSPAQVAWLREALSGKPIPDEREGEDE